jgi:ribosome-binding factor A
MARNPSRTERIGEQIQRDLAGLIRTELKDPRVGMVTLTGVEVSNDYRHARVFFTTLGDAGAIERTRLGLERAAGFLRSQLAGGLKLRVVPELHFEHDQSVARGVELSRLIDEAVASQPPDPDED